MCDFGRGMDADNCLSSLSAATLVGLLSGLRKWCRLMFDRCCRGRLDDERMGLGARGSGLLLLLIWLGAIIFLFTVLLLDEFVDNETVG